MRFEFEYIAKYEFDDAFREETFGEFEAFINSFFLVYSPLEIFFFRVYLAFSSVFPISKFAILPT